MNKEVDTVSSWFVVGSGKVYGRCPACYSQNISYHKTRAPGLRGISSSSKGLSPACMDCGQSLPTQLSKKDQKQLSLKTKIHRTR
ncbi:MAG TPA: hypothetical protein VNJ08_07190 [Bacteriovoracaceae bacterium]|nr:hypothetical protein [Bacteriovoracaceae bacterium]